MYMCMNLIVSYMPIYKLDLLLLLLNCTGWKSKSDL